MKKSSFVLLAALFFCLGAGAQIISAADAKTLKSKQDSLKKLAVRMMTDSLPGGRLRSDSLFTRTLVRSLQVKNSFYFPFDSVRGISRLYAPDSTFRLITWELSLEDYNPRQRGAIQYRTPDGSLKLVPLRDVSEFTENASDSARTAQSWIGAVYYQIIQTEYNGKTYYTLFGFDGNAMRSTRKWIEVLYFDKDNKPVFGGPFFSFANDTPSKKPRYRFNIEYKKEASTTVRYNSDYKVIVYDHLTSESEQPDNPWTLVPDGDYEGFRWQDGKWVHIQKVFDEMALPAGKPPMPQPLRDGKGNFIPKDPNENKTKEVLRPTPGRKGGG